MVLKQIFNSSLQCKSLSKACLSIRNCVYNEILYSLNKQKFDDNQVEQQQQKVATCEFRCNEEN